MAWTRERQPTLNVQQLIDRVYSTGQLSRLEYLQLTTAVLSDYHVTDEQGRQINRIFDEVQAGRLKLVGRSVP